MGDEAKARKQWLQKQFRSSSIQVEPAALTKLAQVVADVDKPEDFLKTLLDEIETGAPSASPPLCSAPNRRAERPVSLGPIHCAQPATSGASLWRS